MIFDFCYNIRMKTWDLTRIYKSKREWEYDFFRAEKMYEQFKKMLGFVNNSNQIRKMLNLEEKFNQKIEKLFFYASLQLESSNEDKYKEMYNRIYKLNTESFTFVNFLISKELSKFSAIRLQNLIKQKNMKRQSARLNEYYLTSKKTDTKLARVTSQYSDILDRIEDVSGNIFSKISEEMEKVANSQKYQELSERNKRKVMKYKECELRKKNESILFDLITMHISSRKTRAMQNNQNSTVNYLLDEVNLDEHTLEQYFKILRSFKSTFSQYINLRKKYLGYRKYCSYDGFFEIFKTKKINLDEGMGLIKDSLAILGDEYLQNIKYLEKNRCMRVNVIKPELRTDSLCYGQAYSEDPYLMVNYNQTINAVSTFSHEIGHAVHKILKAENNHFFDWVSETMIEETAAFVNEILVLNHVRKNVVGIKGKLNATIDLMDLYFSYIYNNLLSINFEFKMYQTMDYNEEFSLKTIKNIRKDIYGKYCLVDDVNVIIDDWAYDRQIFADFYNLKYFIAICTASIFAEKIINNEEGAVENYLNFLKEGNTDGFTLLKKYGVDISSTQFICQMNEKIKKILSDLNDLMIELKN